MISVIKKSYDILGSSVNSRYADLILGILFYIEAICFLPTDPLLIIYCLERRDKAYNYAAIATIASVLGGLSSYIIGFFLWRYWGQHIIYHSYINYVVSPQTFLDAMDLYRRYAWWAILIVGFTPIPFKVATLTAGFCNIPLIPFIVSSIIVRGIRFYLYAFVISWFGVHIKQSLSNYWNKIILVLFIIFGCIIFFMQYH